MKPRAITEEKYKQVRSDAERALKATDARDREPLPVDPTRSRGMREMSRGCWYMSNEEKSWLRLCWWSLG